MQAILIGCLEMNKKRIVNLNISKFNNYGVEETKIDRANYLEVRENWSTPYGRRRTEETVEVGRRCY